MQRKDLLILIVALGCGIVAFFMILSFLKNSSRPPVRVVIATQDLLAGKEVLETDVTLSQPLKNLNVSEVYFQPADVIGLITSKDIVRGGVIFRANVGRPKDVVESSVVLPVPYGLKSFTLSAGEFEKLPDLKAGDYVDILGTMPNFEGKAEMQSLIRGIPVLSVNKKDGQITTLGLAVSPKAADLLIRASNGGKLRILMGEEQPEKIVYQPPAFTEIIRGVSREKYKSTEEQKTEQPRSNATGLR